MADKPVIRWRIQFESISAVRYPQMYDQRTDRARQDIDWDSIPEDWWTTATSEHDSEARSREQYAGLLKLIEEGEFIRNVRLSCSTAPEWEEIDRG